MDMLRGPSAEVGVNTNLGLAGAREEVKGYIAKELELCRLVGIQISVYEIGIIEDKLAAIGLLGAELHLHQVYPGLLEDTAGSDLDPLYLERLEKTGSARYHTAA
jgi:hypothetical protein